MLLIESTVWPGTGPFLRAGFEMSCLDLAGRALEVPAHILLGGAHRTEIETKFVLPARDVETVRRMAEDLRELDVGTVKVKVGLGVATDVARVAVVRESPRQGRTDYRRCERRVAAG